VARAIALLREAPPGTLDLGRLAERVGGSPSSLQRTFAAWAGVSPKRFALALADVRARARLRAGDDVLRATLGSELSSPGRLHDLLVNVSAVTPGEARTRGRGLAFTWGVGPTPFGRAFVALTERGIHRLAFLDRDDLDSEGGAGRAVEALCAEWPHASVAQEDARVAALLERVLAPRGAPRPLHLWLRGTNLQLAVWRALLALPSGAVLSYQALAERVSAPRAVRAVANAVARNPVAWVIPCHRVLRADGGVGGYAWGLERKQALLFSEALTPSSRGA
jgi:AraC family transcriptional regulator of adaptative response/methylated-DNA-[protein]-cysteine methyltransferase